MRISITVNGDPSVQQVDPSDTLLSVLREQLHLTGTKWGCLTGDCGACTVIVDGKSVVSCLQIVGQIDGAEVTTIEGIAGREQVMNDLQSAFIAHGAAQCGFCTPGILCSAVALLDRDASPTREEIRAALAGNLCRCTGYEKIYDAVEAAAARLGG